MMSVFKRQKPQVCFVTNELFPEDRGGIGRMMYNFAVYNRDTGGKADVHFLIGGALARSPERIERLAEAFRGLATLHVVPDLKASIEPLPHLMGWAGQSDPHGPDGQMARSFEYYVGLLDAQRVLGRDFDLVEFPDFGGWGQVSMEAKRAGLAFGNTCLSVRVHSTQGILYRVERYAHEAGSWIASQLDAEAFTLKNADIVVGHIPSVLDSTLAHYGLAERENVRCEFPPILMTEEEAPKPIETLPSFEPDFIFSSRLQQFKRPDIFVRAAVAFLEKHPDYQGVFRLVSYGWDEGYIEMLRSIVPAQLEERIQFILDARPSERLDFIAKSVVVQPSDYESLCLFAYEAAAMGRKVILNGACLAFGAFQRWKDRENCLLFDGTVPDLVRIMEDAADWAPQRAVDMKPDAPYWQKRESFDVEGANPDALPETGTVLFYGAESRSELREFLGNILQLKSSVSLQEHGLNLRVLAAASLFDETTPEVARIRDAGAEVVFVSGQRLDPDALQREIEGLQEAVVLLVPRGCEASESFVATGISAMARNPEIVLLGGHIEVFDRVSDRIVELRSYSGEMPGLALMNSRILSAICFLRRDVLSRVPFDYRAGDLWFEAFSRAAVIASEKVSVLPMLAGRMDSRDALTPENSRALTSGLVDVAGMGAGLPGRLLSLDLQRPRGLHDRRTVELSEQQLAQAVQFSPSSNPVSWRPVEFHSNLGGLLVHPLDGHVTVAALPASFKRPKRVEVVIRNSNKRNAGGEFALAFGGAGISEDVLLQQAREGLRSEDLEVGAWQAVPPGETTRYVMSLKATEIPNPTLFLLTKPAEHETSDHCHLVCREVRFTLS